MSKEQNPNNLGEPNSETGLRAKGWNIKKIREIEKTFEELSYEQISQLLNIFGISFGEKIENMEKDSILWTIADDWTFEQIKEELDKII